MGELPRVSIVIPMRNEERNITACLDSIYGNDYPVERLEVIVVDGRSEDRSRELVTAYRPGHSQIRLLDNPKKITSVAMNTGISAASGDIIFMLNAHARIAPTFIRCSVETLREYPEVDAVGGTLASFSEGTVGKAIALAVNSPLGAGGRRYRTRNVAGLINDTVPYAAYRHQVFDRIGLIDEELVRNQDAEFNYRLLEKGGRIYFNPDIASYLHSRGSLGQLVRQQFLTGYWKVRLLQKRFLPTNWRHLVPAAFVGLTFLCGIAAIFSEWARWLLLADVGAYGSAVVVSSLTAGLRGSMKCLPLLPLVFVALHASYGAGTIAGFWDFVVKRRALRKSMNREKTLPVSDR